MRRVKSARVGRGRAEGFEPAPEVVHPPEEELEAVSEPPVKQEQPVQHNAKKGKAPARVKGIAQWSEEENLVRASPCAHLSFPPLF